MSRLFITLFSAALFIHAAHSRAAVVIQYHQIDVDTPAATSVTPVQFAQHMDYLANNDFSVWPLPRLLKAIRNDESLPDKTIAITFDDGYHSVYTNALPIMKKHNFAFTVFINTSLVGGDNFMTWDKLRELTEHGGTIANHSVNHPHLVRALDGESEQQWSTRIHDEVIDAEKIIVKQIGFSPRLLAYPYGEYDNRVKHIVNKLGFVGFTQHSGGFDKNTDWQAIPRFAFGGDYTEMSGFVDKVNSLPMPLTGIVVTDKWNRRLDDTVLPRQVMRPILTLQLPSPEMAQRVQCFATGQGRLDVSVDLNSITTRPKDDLPVGRSRINCTAVSSQKGRFYWYSHLFMRKMDDGRWYPEL